jgi:hypothetical protein
MSRIVDLLQIRRLSVADILLPAVRLAYEQLLDVPFRLTIPRAAQGRCGGS